jgi:hypothetical protein
VTRAPTRAAASLAALLLAAPAAASGPRLWVLALKAPPGLTFTGKSLGDVVAREAERLGGFEVLGPDAVEARVGTAAYQRLVDCAGDPRCLAGAGAGLGVDRVVGGSLAQGPSRYWLQITQVDVSGGRLLGVVTREVPIAARRLPAEVAAASVPVLRGEAEGMGAVLVTSNADAAEVRIDGERVGATPTSRRCPPGKHLVHVSKPGYAEAEPRWVEVLEGRVTDVQVRLEPASPPPEGPAAARP